MRKLTSIGVIALCEISLSAYSQDKDSAETRSTTQSTVRNLI
ncbi:hypothetical protein N42HA_02264 [Lactococcus lactis]|nr:hypothetical protein [Lactococcus lactis]